MSQAVTQGTKEIVKDMTKQTTKSLLSSGASAMIGGSLAAVTTAVEMAYADDRMRTLAVNVPCIAIAMIPGLGLPMAIASSVGAKMITGKLVDHMMAVPGKVGEQAKMPHHSMADEPPEIIESDETTEPIETRHFFEPLGPREHSEPVQVSEILTPTYDEKDEDFIFSAQHKLGGGPQHYCGLDCILTAYKDGELIKTPMETAQKTGVTAKYAGYCIDGCKFVVRVFFRDISLAEMTPTIRSQRRPEMISAYIEPGHDHLCGY